MPLLSSFLPFLQTNSPQNGHGWKTWRQLSFLLLSTYLLLLSSPETDWCQESVPPSPQSQSFRIQKLDLLNGLRTLVVEQKDLPVVSVNLLVRAGSMYDPSTTGGLAFLLAHALFYSNQRKTIEQWKDELEEMGVDFKIRVEPECVVFQGNVPAHNLEPFLNSLSTMVLYPLFRKQNLESARQQVMMHPLLHPEPMVLADRQFRSIVFGKHPYGKSITGSQDSLSRIQPGDLDTFYRSYYLPNNATLVVVGDVMASQITNFIREKWGKWTKSNRPTQLPSKPAIQDRFLIRLLPVHKGNEAAIVYGHLGPSRLTSDFYTLRVLAALLAGRGAESRLVRGFENEKLTCQLLKGDFIFYQEAGLFQLAVQAPNQTAAGILQSIISTIDTLKQARVAEAELKAAQASLIKSFRESLSVPGTVADYITAVELYDLASDYLLTYAVKIEQVTAERVQEAARTYLDTSHAVAVIAGDGEELADELQKRVGPVEILGLAPQGK